MASRRRFSSGRSPRASASCSQCMVRPGRLSSAGAQTSRGPTDETSKKRDDDNEKTEAPKSNGDENEYDDEYESEQGPEDEEEEEASSDAQQRSKSSTSISSRTWARLMRHLSR